MKENYKEITGNLQFKKNKMNILPNLPSLSLAFAVCSRIHEWGITLETV